MTDTGLVERRIDGQQVYRGALLDVRCDRVALPDGGQATREYIVHPGAVMVVPLLEGGRLLMERQYRYPIAVVLLEFPAGKREPGESGQACAERELMEETGYRAAEWAHAGGMHNAPAYATELIDIWFAQGLRAGPRALDPGEFIDLVELGESELDAAAGRGEVTDAKTLVGLLWLQRWRAGQWPLDWRAPLAEGRTVAEAADASVAATEGFELR